MPVSLPEAFEKKYKHLLGEESAEFLDHLTDEAESGLRINPLKASEEIQKSVSESYKPVPWCRTGFYGKISGKDSLFQSGAVYSQEPSAMLVGELASVSPGERVLDLCAAPGGKSTHLAGQLNQEGLLIANEINRKRARILSENIERAGLRNAVVTSQAPEDFEADFQEFFDCVVVDAPCSGEGMMRKDQHAAEQWSLDLVEMCAARQWEILQSALKLVAPGGRLIYSTCTFAPEENEQVIARVLSEYPEFSVQPVELGDGLAPGRPEWADGNPELSGAVRLWPHRVRGEGHFAVVLVRAGEKSSADFAESFQEPDRLTGDQRKYLQEFWEENMSVPLPERFWVRGDHVYQLPDSCPDLSNLEIMRAGVHLGQWKKKRFEPGHALALALPLTDFQQTYEFTEALYKQYMIGATFRADLPDGWCVVTHRGCALGWVKIVKGVAKNFLPKGLRLHF